MAEQKVTLIAEVIAKGQENLKKVDQDLNKLTGKQEKSTKATGKASTSSAQLNKALGKQIPILRSLNPAVGLIGIGVAAAGAAINAAATGARMANQAYTDWMQSIIGATVAANIYTESMMSSSDMKDRVRQASNKLNVDETKLSKLLKEVVLPSVQDVDAAFDLLADAHQLAKDAGVDFDTAVKELTTTFDGHYAQIGAGMPAYDEMVERLKATGDAHQGLKNEVDMTWTKMWSDIWTAIGRIVSDIGTGLKMAALEFMKIFKPGDGYIAQAWNACFSWLSNINWDGIWKGIGAAWSNIWNNAWSFLTDIWGKITGFFSSFSWDNIWRGLGEAWSKIWRAIPNVAISGVNWIIQQMNKLSWSMPDWIPFVGGKTFGFNLAEIPMLAKGGNVTGSGAAIVGEEGPELINFDRGAQVTPLSGGGGMGPITIPVYIGNDLLYSYVINSLEDVVRLRGAV